ncbi:DUF2163 domain-containing protein [Phyllobacterium sp. 21LDTY02-6]|uniref:DUF2163 domain-containing protein n=1 Tax=Phyllobacterium sp. 21LDTY02-6 TaxID=2944903 RepID=UPI00201FE6D3|nr:DUF2163 domain-containing protein [Phyllobacterium sp. 21LDTY02-6]MCO4318339.1 DUF2163 domain-containing protein [Phyllobacterium sp. 21LDTY02-6]
MNRKTETRATRAAGELESNLAGDVTSHCFCWIMRRRDGRVFGFTDHDRTIRIARVDCEPQTGLSASEATSALGLSVDSAEIEGALSAPGIAEVDIENGLFDGATVETHLVNWMAPEQNMLLRTSRIGTISRAGGRFVAEMKSSAVDLDKVDGRCVKRLCDAQLGDARCGYARSGQGGSQNGIVAEILSDREIIVSGVAAPNGWFVNGAVRLPGGGGTVVVNQLAWGAQLRLGLRDTPAPGLKPGDAIVLMPGCDKSFAQCRAKFGNGINFRGFPHLPGNDAIYSFANGRDNFDGGALVP